MIQFIWDNKEWLFSGIGVVVLSLVYHVGYSKLRHQNRSLKKEGVESFFETKAEATLEMVKILSKSDSPIVICAVSLNTLADSVLRNVELIKEIASNLSNKRNVTLTIVVHLPEGPATLSYLARHFEKPRDLNMATLGTIENLRNFKHFLTKYNPSITDQIVFKHYTTSIPRYFIMKGGGKFLVGPYLSYLLSGSSFILSLRDEGNQSLYYYFNKELEKILEDSKEFSPENYILRDPKEIKVKSNKSIEVTT